MSLWRTPPSIGGIMYPIMVNQGSSGFTWGVRATVFMTLGFTFLDFWGVFLLYFYLQLFVNAHRLSNMLTFSTVHVPPPLVRLGHADWSLSANCDP
ncbi:hypothetical protein WOLCODRAFT_153414 [Wolfiporia cocos MD-104 SS10]|uniref:Uncharacterized protein n=1 Tax=Wolfiporia cocos (strain MD-104) TaxID=742152 RepID=A0A2H3JN89_WOLCO|nr:hypothetical protein WOLCODRAFT_153414 [Wolfiporia cocos MD-104 SS10]